MGRMLPEECEHGVVIDWGDFGPDYVLGEACVDCGIEATYSCIECYKLAPSLGAAKKCNHYEEIVLPQPTQPTKDLLVAEKESLLDWMSSRRQMKIDTAAFRSRSRSAQPLELHSMLMECLDELDRLCR
jgi:hypothetical protein